MENTDLDQVSVSIPIALNCRLNDMGLDWENSKGYGSGSETMVALVMVV